jgi:hypothetical protein
MLCGAVILFLDTKGLIALMVPLIVIIPSCRLQGNLGVDSSRIVLVATRERDRNLRFMSHAEVR